VAKSSYAPVYCILYCVYDVVVKKVHVRYLISWWDSCQLIGPPMCTTFIVASCTCYEVTTLSLRHRARRWYNDEGCNARDAGWLTGVTGIAVALCDRVCRSTSHSRCVFIKMRQSDREKPWSTRPDGVVVSACRVHRSAAWPARYSLPPSQPQHVPEFSAHTSSWRHHSPGALARLRRNTAFGTFRTLQVHRCV